MLHPGGHPRNDTYLLHGHIWETEPYVSDSQALGSNPLSNWLVRRRGLDQALTSTSCRKAEPEDDSVYRAISCIARSSRSISTVGSGDSSRVAERATADRLSAMSARTDLSGRLRNCSIIELSKLE
jgi:hypothetical protein